MKRSLSKRAAAGVLRGLTGTLWGEPPFLIEEIVDHLGAAAALRWFVAYLPNYESTMKKWGPIRTHLLCVEASLLNGCSYCTHAHIYAFELHYFKKTGKLFSLDEHQVIALREKPDAELKTTLEQALRSSDVPEEAPLFDQLWRRKFAWAQPVDDTERRIDHLLTMFETLNFCGIDRQVPFDHAHDPINKDKDLKRRYAEARLSRESI